MACAVGVRSKEKPHATESLANSRPICDVARPQAPFVAEAGAIPDGDRARQGRKADFRAPTMRSSTCRGSRPRLRSPRPCWTSSARSSSRGCCRSSRGRRCASPIGTLSSTTCFPPTNRSPSTSGLYPHGESRSVRLNVLGRHKVYCNLHKSMVADILVLPNRFFGLTDAQGRYRIDAPPAGEYVVRVWHVFGGRTRRRSAWEPPTRPWTSPSRAPRARKTSWRTRTRPERATPNPPPKATDVAGRTLLLQVQARPEHLGAHPGVAGWRLPA